MVAASTSPFVLSRKPVASKWILGYDTFVPWDADSIYVNAMEDCRSETSPLPSWLREPLGRGGVQLTLTPLNNLIYNTRFANLAQHGLHPHYLHAAVNMQLLFSPLWIFALLRRSAFATSKRAVMVAVIMCGLCTLSLAPHQEPRFLMPLILPIAVLTTEVVTRNGYAQFFWLVFNIILGIFYGFVHQGGVVPALLAIEGELFESQQTIRCIASYETYMMPRFLLTDHNVTTVDLMGTAPARIPSILRDAGCPGEEWYFLMPAICGSNYTNSDSTIWTPQ
ncbi:GPI mannosyltransferase 4 [Hondaea fermentalgiana]|uniref:Mannosyltransferase n=1 Tax=Hondaea fermentalgiana TaxID=2315210 RepID=A0A2R5GLV0_9STRA|nr:GPI mannosyltransferase 4 [Hondaea fermentalgiana]|eukprot:GBG31289.1 GPI mannosyltransferase 4 [Hondaea fermentalgiana]